MSELSIGLGIFAGVIIFANMILAITDNNVHSALGWGLALFLQIAEGLGFGGSFKHIRNTFTLDREMNVPATFSAIILLIAAGLLFVVFVARRKKRALFTTHWGFLSLIFVFLAYDEMFSFHESMIGPLRRFVNIGGIFSYEWIILAIPLVLILGISYFRFVFHLPPNIRILFILAALLFLGGSIGGEMFSGWYASKFGEGDANYVMLTIFEETLEMSGIVIFIHALLLTCYDSLEKRKDESKNHLEVSASVEVNRGENKMIILDSADLDSI